jgi:23S rRNA pseudouridine1911/1915/1917 synthase
MVIAGDDVRVIEPLQAPTLQPNLFAEIEALYQDESVLVVNKPGLMPCHPLKSGERHTVMNAVIATHPEAATAGDKPLEGGLVHRLDNGTSGALIIARTPQAFAVMREAIRCGAFSRRYLALSVGYLEKEIEIATPIIHHSKNRRKMSTPRLGTAPTSARPAATLVRPLQRFAGLTLIEAKPSTGRRHQLRVHLASIGHPLVGDTLYGGPKVAELTPGRFWLHLSELAFKSPSRGDLTVQAPLPAELDAILCRLSRGAQLSSPHL